MSSRHALLGVAAAASLSTLAGAASATPCGTGVLSDWLAPGFSCTISDKTFSDFTYNNAGFAAPASSVGVMPVGDGTTTPGILFNGGWTNSGTTNLDAVIGFTVTAPDTLPITSANLTVSGIIPGTTFSDVETLSNGVVLFADQTNPGPISADFDPVTVLTQFEDLVVYPGTTGATVGISLLTKDFGETPTTVPPVLTLPPPGAAIPEPGSLALLGSMLVGFGWLGRRRFKAT